MVRNLLAGILLTTFLVATTGFVLVQCCCDLSPKKECCRADNTEGCKDQVSYYKLSTDFHAAASQQLSFFSFACGDLCFDFQPRICVQVSEKFSDDTGPPLIALNALSRLQVFRI